MIEIQLMALDTQTTRISHHMDVIHIAVCYYVHRRTCTCKVLHITQWLIYLYTV